MGSWIDPTYRPMPSPCTLAELEADPDDDVERWPLYARRKHVGPSADWRRPTPTVPVTPSLAARAWQTFEDVCVTIIDGIADGVRAVAKWLTYG